MWGNKSELGSRILALVKPAATSFWVVGREGQCQNVIRGLANLAKVSA